MGIGLASVVFSSFSMEEEVSKSDDLVFLEIPLDLQIKIMTRLPAKSLMRFKCVSKLWFSLIRSRYLTNLYLTVASPTRSPCMYMSFTEHGHCDSMEVCHNPGKSLLVSLSSSSSNNAETFHLDHDLTMPGMGGNILVILRGLILYKVCRKACIYNPTTRQKVTLPIVKSDIFAQEGFEKDVYYCFGHDPVLDQYKVVCNVVLYSKDFETLTSEHWVLVLEVGGFWKRIEFNQPHWPKEQGVCIDGVIYYFANTSISSHILVSFDVRSEEFGMVQTPHDVSEGFIEYCGKPAIFYHANLPYSGLVDLWVLEDGGKWLKKSLVLQPSQMHLVDNDIDLTEVGTTKNGEVILDPVQATSTYYILYYDLQKNHLRKVEIRGITEYLSSYYHSFDLFDKSESIMHVEI